MYKIPVYDINGKKIKDLNLNEVVFNDENINNDLIHEFIVMQQANARQANAHTKNRWEVTCSGKKLFRQKGTWRARVGDAWSPIRRKGWVAFGPRNNRNYEKDMPKKMRRKALFGALTMKARDNEILGLDKYPYEAIKTKDAFEALKNLWLADTKTLFVIPENNEVLVKSFRNVPNVKYVFASYVNPYDLLTYKKVLFLEESLNKIQEVFVK